MQGTVDTAGSRRAACLSRALSRFKESSVRFETYVAFRYLRGKRKSRFISLITLISVAGVSVGVIALIVVMSVMTGFDIALEDTIIGNRAHLTFQDFFGRAILDHENLIAAIEARNPEIVASAPIVQIEALFKSGSKSRSRVTGGLIIGIEPEQESNVTYLASNLTREDGRTHGRGALPGTKEIVLGYRVAQRLGVDVGDYVGALTFRERNTPWGTVDGQELWLTVSGIAEAQRSDIDEVYTFVDLETARMLREGRGVDAVHCKLTDPDLADAVGDRVLAQFNLKPTTWYESQQEFFEALKQEKVVMFIILVFIILVAAFNITSTLIMVVMEKRRDIGILRTIGTSGPAVMRVFVLEGLFIGLGGTLVGVVAGTVLAYNINPVAEFIAGLFGIDLFNSKIYYFNRIPVEVVPLDIFWITACAVILTFLSTLYPAWSASRLNPVDALRYE